MEYKIGTEDEETSGRIGKLITTHGEVDTPVFMPVATMGTVKTMDNADLGSLEVKALISNAFLLYLKPGMEVIQKAGGLHKFMNWKNILFTDSGGFQMIRRDFLKGVDMNGVKFNSPFDGQLHEFTPEKNMEVQLTIGADILMVQDDCPKITATVEEVSESLQRTLNWAERCKARFEELADTHRHSLFAIVQGGLDLNLREKCIEELVKMDFSGYAIGGLSIGEAKSDMYRVLEFTTPKLPREKPRYLMGVGSPEDILESIAIGVDVFDSVFPTRNARHSTIYTNDGRVNIGRSPFKGDLGPLDDDCGCFTCKNHSRAYVNHLLKHREPLGIRLTTMHNLHFLLETVEHAKTALREGDFKKFKDDFISRYKKD